MCLRPQDANSSPRTYNPPVPRLAQVPPLSSHQARYVLEKLIDEGKVSASDVRRHLSGIWEEMSFLEKRVAELRGATEPIRARLKKAARRVVSSERKASQKLQGRYLGFIRQIPEKSRARYQRIAKVAGRQKAIDAMREALGK